MILMLRLCLFQLLLKLAKIWHFYRSENYVVIVQKSFTAMSPDRSICIQYTSYSPNNCCFIKILRTSHFRRTSQCSLFWEWRGCSGISNTFCWIKHRRDGRDCLYSWVCCSSCHLKTGPSSTGEELGLIDVSKGKLKGRVETLLLLGAILGKKMQCLKISSENNRNIWIPPSSEATVLSI